MAEIRFYQALGQTVEKVLPALLERCLARGWRCAVEAAEERLPALDERLWTYDAGSFLPHGIEADDGAHQPVVLVGHPGNPNGAQARFLLDGADIPADAADYERVFVLFDGRDADAVAGARGLWRKARSTGLPATYWQQDEGGRWAEGAGRG